MGGQFQFELFPDVVLWVVDGSAHNFAEMTNGNYKLCNILKYVYT